MELSQETLDQAYNGEFSAFASTIKKVLDQKVKNHPYIKTKKEELDNFTRMKDIFAKIGNSNSEE